MRSSRSMAGIWRRSWPALVVTVVARTVLIAVLSAALWTLLPHLLGWTPTVVMSGSMQPRIMVGDVVVSRPVAVDALRPGMVLLVPDPDVPGRLRLHRYVGTVDGALQLRGDANAAPDSDLIDPSDVIGCAVLRSPMIGLPFVWAAQGDWGRVGLTGAALLLVVGGSLLFSTREPGDPPGSADPDRPERRRARARAGLAAAGVLPFLLAGGGVAVPAYAAFSRTTQNSGDSWAAAAYYRCSAAAVGLGAAAAWPLDDDAPASGAGTGRDVSGNNRPLTWTATGVTYGQPTTACPRDPSANARTPYATTLDGSTGYGSSASTVAVDNTLTLAIWFKTTTTRGGRLIGFGSAQTGASSNYDRHIYMQNDGRLTFGVYPNAVRIVTSPSTYNDGAFHQAVASLGAAGMKLYVDGVLVASDAATTTAEGAFPNGQGYLRVGYDNLDSWPNAPASYFFAGSVRYAQFFGTQLSDSRVLDDYQAGSAS